MFIKIFIAEITCHILSLLKSCNFMQEQCVYVYILIIREITCRFYLYGEFVYLYSNVLLWES